MNADPRTSVPPVKARPVRSATSARSSAGPQRAPQPLPRLLLHLEIELVRGVEETAALTVGDAGLGVAARDLVEGRLDALERKQAVLRSVDDHDPPRCDERG